MTSQKKISRQSQLWMGILICVCLALVLGCGEFYLTSLRDDVMEQAVSNVLTVTRQQQQAINTFISGDRERLHSFANHFSQTDSTDIDRIQENLDVFSTVDAYYTVINLETGVFCNNQERIIYQMDSQKLEYYRSLSGADIRNPFVGLYADDIRFGYYECFTFADGTPGLFQKSYNCSTVSEEFSLSFYNGQGLGFVVTRTGEILLRSVDKTGAYSFDNIFDFVAESAENQDNINHMTAELEHQKSGSVVLTGENGNYFYTYVPIQSVKGWYLISVVPAAAVTQEADTIVMNSRSMLLIFLAVVAVLLTFFFLVWFNRKGMEEKDLEIEYHERQFDIFSTYLSNNTDDVYMMLNASDLQVEYISPNVERVLGVPEEAILKDVRALGFAKYLAGEPVDLSSLRRMKPGDSLPPKMTERMDAQTCEQKWFRETVYCVSLQDENKIIAYISDRTKERQTQNALTEALDMAQAANKAKSSFLGSVSHDIRTPMNAIMGLVMLLRQEAGDPKRVLEYTQRIDAASQHLLGLINDVLDMNKIEGGGATLNISELSLPDIIEELNTIIRPQTRAKNQTFKILASSFTYEHLLGDKLRINQILINILSNAVKYTPAGGEIELRVNELPQVMKDYSHVQFIVRDNGQGMSEEYLQVIFDPFTREQNAATNQIQGTGLGMAITKQLVDLMGGSIHVDSTLGHGSVFTLELDLRIQEQETEADQEFWKSNSVTRMIVADDDESICHNVVKTMSKTGVSVHYATSGQKAIQMMRTAREDGVPYDLILLDWKMPDLDGLETARLIRKNYSKKIPIFFFTAYDWGDIEEEAREIGVDHFLPKPFFIHSFKAAIQRLKNKQTPTAPLLESKESEVDGKHILVVDDVEVNRMILVKILGSMGAVCDVAENGQRAVEQFTASQPGEYDLILMDVQMPLMNGYDATKAIRSSAHKDAKRIPIIAMTANAFVDDVRDALAAGMDAHVSKPIVLDQLRSTIQEVLSRKGQ